MAETLPSWFQWLLFGAVLYLAINNMNTLNRLDALEKIVFPPV